MRVILIAAFGLHDLHSVKLPYLQNGQTRQVTIGDFLRLLTSFMIFRSGRYLLALIPYLIFFYYSAEDREYMQNIKTVRTFIENLVKERKTNMDKFKDSVDLLTILCQDEYFVAHNSAMVDEIITMFLAGSFTLKTSNSNLIQYLALNPEVHTKLMKEIKGEMLKGLDLSKPVDTEKVFTYDSVEQMRYFVQCFYESLRIEPPSVSSGAIFTEAQTIGGKVNMRKGDLFIINIQ